MTGAKLFPRIKRIKGNWANSNRGQTPSNESGIKYRRIKNSRKKKQANRGHPRIDW
jgi:hypothetical protein